MKHLLPLSLILSTAFALCHHGTTLKPRAFDPTKPIPAPDYSFSGIDGPTVWHSIDDDYAVCAHGQTQSPIDISTSQMSTINGSCLDFAVKAYPDGAPILNLGVTLEVIAEGTMVRDGKKFELAQFHFHTPSEHHIDGVHYPVEVHFVFQASDETLSAIGFPIEIGSQSESFPLLKSIFSTLSTITEPLTHNITGALDFTALQAHLVSSEVFQYSGSLTVPPCLEGVLWNVVKNPIYMDVETYRAAKNVMGFNSRFVQNGPGKMNLIEMAVGAWNAPPPEDGDEVIPVELFL